MLLKKSDIRNLLRKFCTQLLNKHFYVFVFLIIFDYLLVPQLFFIFLGTNIHFDEIDPKKVERVTIGKLLQNVSRHALHIDLISKIPHRNRISPDEKNSFIYQRAVCNQLTRIKGLRNHFRICYPPKVNETGKLVYFINVRRDALFEQNFKKILFKDTKLKIFTKGDPSNGTDTWPDDVVDTVEDIFVKVYTEETEDKYGQRIIGIKDLIDERDNYHMIEFLKYEMENTTDHLMFSINTPVYAPHLLLRLQHFAYAELHYLIKRLAFSLYFPYSVQHDPNNGMHYISLIHQFSMNKYEFSGIAHAKWQKRK